MANGFKELKPFRFWCHKVLPLVYDDSLSYYELLCKVIEALNLTMEDVELLNNYFDGIEVQEEIDKKLDSMVEDGTLDAIMKTYIDENIDDFHPEIIQHITSWLNTNITEPAENPIDKTFTIPDAGAESYRTGEIFRNLNSMDLLNDITMTSSVFNGISYQWDADYKKCSVAGTATAESTSVNLFSNTGAFIGTPYPCKPGDILEFKLDSTDSNIDVQTAFYINNAWDEVYTFNDTFQIHIPENATGILIRLHVGVGKIVNGTIKVFAYNVASNEKLFNGLPVISPTKYDCQTIINSLLEKYHGVQLCAGTYNIRTPIEMPEGSIIRGMGVSSMIQMYENAHGVIMGTNCTIENVCIKGAVANGIVTDDSGTAYGIFIDGNGGNTYRYNCRIHNVTVRNFSKAGIYIKGLGGNPLNSCSITNCQIYYANVGIYLESTAEYNRIANCSIFSCYNGVVNYSGNNKFIGCDFSGNTNAFYLNMSSAPDKATNNGHGSCVGCTFNHNSDNTGYAIIANSIDHGFVFTGCQFWYGKIYSHSALSPMMFDGCEFRGTADGAFELHNASTIIIANSLFEHEPVRQAIENSRVILTECYLKDGTLITG